MKDVDVSDPANQEKLIAVLNVFEGLAMQVKTVGAEIPKDSNSDTEAFIDRLKEIENLFFFTPSEPSESASGGGA